MRRPTLRETCLFIMVALPLLASPTARTHALGTAKRSPNKPVINLAAFRGQGALAFPWEDRLYVLDGDKGALASVPLIGPINAMAWSPDGHWLAYIAASVDAYQGGPLWVVRRDGGAAHQITGLPGPASTFSWSPVADVLAIGLPYGAPDADNLWVASPTGRARRVQGAVAGAWSPDGASLAYGATLPFAGPEGRSDALFTAPATGGAAIQRYTAKDSGIIVVGWWPDGRGILFFVDPMHSASIAADGLKLYSLPLGAGGTPRPLILTLRHADWLARSPSGRNLLVVAGGGRQIWSNKALATCDVQIAACRTLPQPAGVISLDPAWSPRGNRIAFVRARDAGDIGGFGSTQNLMSWVRTRTLWVADARGGQARQLLGAAGIYAPQWSRDGAHLLYLRDNAVWLIGANGVAPTRIVGPFPGPFDLSGYYGHVSWSGVLAWDRV